MTLKQEQILGVQIEICRRLAVAGEPLYLGDMVDPHQYVSVTAIHKLVGLKLVRLHRSGEGRAKYTLTARGTRALPKMVERFKASRHSFTTER